MLTWKCLHLYADAHGTSRVDSEYKVTLSEAVFAPPAPSMYVSQASSANALAFMELPLGWKGDWHPSPHEQWVICLAGEMGYEAGDGTIFTLKPGSYILTTDTRGQGHKSWNAGNEPVQLAIVQI
jgi:quercetin dioxygenase-like cupin family protein